jgi:hypothetical protein
MLVPFTQSVMVVHVNIYCTRSLDQRSVHVLAHVLLRKLGP